MRQESGACELADLCREEHGVEGPAHPAPRAQEPVLDGNPFLRYDPNLCIRCQRCVGACNAAARNHALRTGKRGTRTTLVEAPFGPDWRASACESCGNCAQACPTGALVEKRRGAYRSWETERVRTTCPHCGVGCQLDLVVKDGRIVDAEGAPGPSNKGLLCVKGRSGSFDFVDAPDRLTAPLVRNAATGELEPASWDDALDLVARRFAELRDEHGGEALAAFACSRSTNEDIYLFQKMARISLRHEQRGLLRACLTRAHRSPVWRRMLGSGAMTNSIDDVCRKRGRGHARGVEPRGGPSGHRHAAARRRGAGLHASSWWTPATSGWPTQADLHI